MLDKEIREIKYIGSREVLNIIRDRYKKENVGLFICFNYSEKEILAINNLNCSAEVETFVDIYKATDWLKNTSNNEEQEFIVEIKELLSARVKILAKDSFEAITKACNMYKEEKVVLDYNNLLATEYVVVG
ncbi:DpnD/PcfM family protein [Clostridium paraputrificum]|uniref:DpnD/PcfM family protein n=1 Tax=Clostridium paraputrificum TaxID=29363 RepID=UPI002FCD987F